MAKLKGMEKGDGAAAQYAELLHDTAVVSSGYEISDPAAFAKRITALMADGEAGLAALATAAAATGTAEAAAASAAEATVTTEAEVAEGAEEEIILPDDEDDTPEEDKPITPEVM